MEVAKEMPAGSTVVCLLPDSIRNYMTRHLMDEWLLERELMPLPSVPQNDFWYNATCAQLKLTKVSSGLPLDIKSDTVVKIMSRAQWSLHKRKLASL